MMLLNELSKKLTDKFNLETCLYPLDENIDCHTYDFQSDISFHYYDEKELFKLSFDGTKFDCGEKENQNFRYAIFAPAQNRKFSEAIILLHGLNERNWGKYLPWAHYLASQTQKPVILFPIAYHMNRSPKTWICPRLMNKFSSFRKTTIPGIENSTFANAALSLRMDKHPYLFSMSGIQTYFDVIKLTSAIKNGHFEIFANNCHVNFFAYSIGALLTKILLISNPLQLFPDSKAFFFCGGSTFDKINGNSRAIMDNQAFANLRNHMLNNTDSFEKQIEIPEQHSHLLKDGWNALLAMSGIKSHIKDREYALNNLINRIKAIGLKDDFVVPGSAIKETFFDVDVMDFPFKYSHETPFPINDNRVIETVTQTFNLVFNRASLFLA